MRARVGALQGAGVVVAAIMCIAACGGGAPVGASPGTGTFAPAAATPVTGGGPGGVITDATPPGEADMTIAGQTFSYPTASTCDMSVEGEFNFNFLAQDGSDIRAGGFRSDELGWLGSINVYLLDGSGYTASLPGATSLTIAGNSLVFTGPIGFNPPFTGQDVSGGLPTPQPMGEGTIRATCP